MKKFEFDIVITAPSKQEAMEKMQALKSIGSGLSLSELQALAKTIGSPAALAIAKDRLGLS